MYFTFKKETPTIRVCLKQCLLRRWIPGNQDVRHKSSILRNFSRGLFQLTTEIKSSKDKSPYRFFDTHEASSFMFNENYYHFNEFK